MEQTGSVIYDRERRRKTVQAVLTDLMPPLYRKRKEEAWRHYREHQEKMRRGFYEAVRSAIQKKTETEYLCLSYLLSGVLSGKMLLKLDCYDRRWYADTKESGGYWNYQELFPHVEEDMECVRRQLKQSVLRVMEYEVEEFRICDQVFSFNVLMDILNDIVREEFRRVYMPELHELPISVLFGAYLGETQKLTVWEGVET